MINDEIDSEEFAPIAAAMKRLPQFAPSAHFADSVMAHVRTLPAALPQVQPQRAAVAPPAYVPRLEARRSVAPAPHYARSLTARIAAVALLGSLSVTVSAVALIAMFQADLFVLVARVFGESTIAFIAALGTDAVSAAGSTTSGIVSGTAAGTGAAVAASFAAGLAAATVGIRAAANVTRKAA